MNEISSMIAERLKNSFLLNYFLGYVIIEKTFLLEWVYGKHDIDYITRYLNQSWYSWKVFVLCLFLLLVLPMTRVVSGWVSGVYHALTDKYTQRGMESNLVQGLDSKLYRNHLVSQLHSGNVHRLGPKNMNQLISRIRSDIRDSTYDEIFNTKETSNLKEHIRQLSTEFKVKENEQS
jgi:hypothetical protein